MKMTLQNAVKLSLRNLSYLIYKFLRMGNTIFLFPKCEIRNVSYLSHAILIFIIETTTILFLCDWNKEIRKIVKISLRHGAWDAHAHIIICWILMKIKFFTTYEILCQTVKRVSIANYIHKNINLYKESSLLFHELVEMKSCKFYESKVSKCNIDYK